MMNEHKLKEEICEIGRRLYAKGFAAANDGNITIRLNEREVLCTPTMVSKGFLKPEDVCKVDYEGKQLAGTKRRTSEVLLHLAVYKTPGNQKFAETIVPYLKDCNTIILANHGTVSFGPNVEAAYFNTEII